MSLSLTDFNPEISYFIFDSGISPLLCNGCYFYNDQISNKGNHMLTHISMLLHTYDK